MPARGRFPLPLRAGAGRVARPLRAPVPPPRAEAGSGPWPAASRLPPSRSAGRDPPASVIAPGRPPRSRQPPAAGQHVRHQVRGLGGTDRGTSGTGRDGVGVPGTAEGLRGRLAEREERQRAAEPRLARRGARPRGRGFIAGAEPPAARLPWERGRPPAARPSRPCPASPPPPPTSPGWVLPSSRPSSPSRPLSPLSLRRAFCTRRPSGSRATSTSPTTR